MRAGVKGIIERLGKKFPDAKCTLDYTNPLELLVATILSAQCTDERVNIVTKTLFKKYKKLQDYANVALAELEKDIKSTGFYKNKAKNIKNACIMIAEKFGGEIPKTMGELTQLPGVARKTANVVLGNAYNIIEGIVVDTHVLRVSQRLGLTKNTNPEKIELDLMKIVPRDLWLKIGHLFIMHGRYVCMAKKPLCNECVLNRACPSFREFGG